MTKKQIERSNEVICMKGMYKNRKLIIAALSQREMELADRNNSFEKHVVISIVCPGDDNATIRSGPKAILRLEFYDLPESLPGYETVFENKDAKSVRRFIEKHIDDVDSIIIHCLAGVSRSVGMAAALAKVLFGDDSKFFERGRPNSRVYKKLLDSFNESKKLHEDSEIK